MMMNERVEMGGGVAAAAAAAVVNEQLVRLHSKLKRIAKARSHLDLQEAEALREAQRLGLWREFGYASLVDYMIRELGYEYRTAQERLRVANALPELPKLAEALHTGELNFSQARELSRVVTPETEDTWIEKTKEMSVREVEQAVAGHCKGSLPEDAPDPRLIRKTLYLSVRPETGVLYREARAKLEKERGEKLDDDAVLEALCRTLLSRGDAHASLRAGVGASASHAGADAPSSCAGADAPSSHAGADAPLSHAGVGASASHAGADAPSSRAETAEDRAEATVPVASSSSSYRVAVTVCSECSRGWRHGAGAVVEMSPPAIEVALCDAQLIGDVRAEHVERAHEAISPATRRKVLHRDQNRCRVPGCCAHTNLDIHHIVHREHGGTNEPGNLIVLCEAHHLAHHDGTLVIARDANGAIEFRREGRNSFTRATREVETREELRRRGFDRDAIKQIMLKVGAHVSTSSLQAEQWLSLALRYAEQLGLTS